MEPTRSMIGGTSPTRSADFFTNPLVINTNY